jgi:hypothetical protein
VGRGDGLGPILVLVVLVLVVLLIVVLGLLQIADAVAREKVIDRQIVIEAMEEAIAKAARSRGCGGGRR